MADATRIPAAVLDEYRRAGWHITEHGRPDPGTTTGPCGRCRNPTEIYGPNAQGLCRDCKEDNGA